MHSRHSVIIVGSGVGGMAAVDLLSGYGLRVLVIDDNARIGGQLMREPPHPRGTGRRFEPDRIKLRGLRLADRLRNGKIQILNTAQVLGVFPERTLLVEDGRGYVSEYRADAVILATGARERHLPFKGWTIPGVMSTGGAQILMKSSGILPGRSTLIGGCSPLMLVLAEEILNNRGKVQAILDQSPVAAKMKAITAGPVIWPKLLEGIFYLALLAAARVPVRQGVRIVEARGRKHLETIVTARADARGHLVQGTEGIYHADTLAVGYGFSPNIELPQQAGCRISYAVDKGGWHVDVSASMATSVNDIYAVGETTGIAGAGKSIIEGQIAAWHILFKQGRVNQRISERHIRPLRRRRSLEVRYGRFLNRLCQPQLDCYADIPDETTICRCEEITMGEIRSQLKNGFITMKAINKATRCAMGNCQGRTCGPILSDIIGAFTRRPAAAVGYTSARAPVKTVALGSLARMKIDSSEVHEKTDARLNR